ncbi:MAG: uroporphyrinogen-III synthase [Hyphomonadaceae bacterium]
MRVLVTRAIPEAESTAARLRALGHEALLSPALVIEALAFAFDPAGVQALLFTSAAAVRAFGLQPLPAIVVGPGTAEAARAMGYAPIVSAGGAGADLVARAGALDPKAGALVHVRGENTATDIAGALSALGYDARELIVYRARPSETLSEAARAQLGALDAVLFHSARGAQTFARLAYAQGGAGALARMRAFCLSARIASAIEAAGFQEIRIAAAPNETALVELLGAAP